MTVDAHGEVLPKTESNLVSEVAGRVVAVAPAMVSGGFFAKGDVLVEVEQVDYEVVLEQSRARRVGAESELENAEKAHRRAEELAGTQSVSESVRDDAVNRLNLAPRIACARPGRRCPVPNAIWNARAWSHPTTAACAPSGSMWGSSSTGAKPSPPSTPSTSRRSACRSAMSRLAFLPLSLAQADDGMPMPKVILRAEFAGAEHAWEAHVVRTEGELDPRTRMVNVIAPGADLPTNRQATRRR